ncbi:hypothetical protein IGI04_034476 [Brassica rapa subsp. trilocularis]|uniref:Uncharacterized protein n=1 Tax=Brassica rapa subsp. trilocularis TaxID=1813537 RepID=A0ABQ7LB31_BRACM|nr:hypothetical protein IGI04_034476 [Brassica rapa subsp. trilocularis]
MTLLSLLSSPQRSIRTVLTTTIEEFLAGFSKYNRLEGDFKNNLNRSTYGGDDADDDDNPDGIPVPVQVETGEGSSDAVKDADEKADDHAPKKRIHSSINAAKIVHV